MALAKPSAPVPWFVYVLRCNDGSLYCGIARDVRERVAKHEAGKGAKYTRGRGPLKIEAVRRCKCHGDALRLELAVKRLPRLAKEELLDVRRFRALQRAVVKVAAKKAPKKKKKASARR